eukprot:SAG31_NODE_38139_length_298_cov_1.547739_1_plen_71_part_10
MGVLLTAQDRSSLEQILHCFYHGRRQLRPQTKYHARRFKTANLLAAPQPLEVLDFANGKGLCRPVRLDRHW